MTPMQVPWGMSYALKELSFLLLREKSSADLVTLGYQVKELVAKVKEHHPNLVSLKHVPSGLLGGTVATPDDFTIAERLIEGKDAIVADEGKPLLLAYIAVVSIADEIPGPLWASAAIAYLTTRLQVDRIASESWRRNLEDHLAAQAPLASVGRKFVQNGRPAGSLSPLARALDRLLKKNPKASAQALWNTLKAKPPRGMNFYEPGRGSPYIEHEKKGGGMCKPTTFRSFENAVTKSRQRLGITIKRTMNHS